MLNKNIEMISDEIIQKEKENLKEIFHKKSKSLILFYLKENIFGDKVVEKFLAFKKTFGESLGCKVEILEINIEDLEKKFKNNLVDIENEIEKSILEKIKNFDGCIIQLPIPKILNLEKFLNLIPKEKDVDILGDNAKQDFLNFKNNFYHGIVGSILKLKDFYKIDFQDKNIAILGRGRLVGEPISLYFDREKINYKIFDEKNKLESYQDFDIIFTGVGLAHFLKSKMVKDGVVVFDCGTSLENGILVGDVCPSVYKKSAFYTPVKKSIGPLTILTIFENLSKI